MIEKPIVLTQYKHPPQTTRAQLFQENSIKNKDREFSFKKYKTEKERIVN